MCLRLNGGLCSHGRLVSTGRKRIYIAGPLFADHERRFLKEIVRALAEMLEVDPVEDVFLPYRDAGEASHGRRALVFEEDIKRLEEADIVIALLDGVDVDSGTCVELGYAYARGKAIFGVLTDFRKWDDKGNVQNLNLMVWGVCERGKTISRGIDDKLIGEIRKALKRTTP